MNLYTKYILGFAALGVAVFFSWYFFSIIVYILLAAAVSFLGKPIIDLLGRISLKGHRLSGGLKSGITLICLWCLFILVFSTLIPLAAREFQSLENINLNTISAQLQQPMGEAGACLKEYGLLKEDVDLGKVFTDGLGSFLDVTLLKDWFGTLADTMSSLFVALFSITFISFFFLKDSCLFTRMVLAVVPTSYEEQARNALETIERLLVRYFVGLVLEVAGVMGLDILGLSLVGLDMDHAVVIGLVAGVLNVIPYIGPLIGICFGVVAGLVLHLDLEFYHELLPMLFYIGLVMSVTQLVDNLLFQPFIYGNSVHAHPLEIFLVILMAGSMAGIPGMILAIPAYTVLRVVLKEFFNKYKLVKKLTQSLNN